MAVKSARGKEKSSDRPGKPEGQDHRERIAKSAYYKAEKRGFVAGYDLQDWLEAEREADGGSSRLDD